VEVDVKEEIIDIKDEIKDSHANAINSELVF
jgi:hypothetical protein